MTNSLYDTNFWGRNCCFLFDMTHYYDKFATTTIFSSPINVVVASPDCIYRKPISLFVFIFVFFFSLTNYQSYGCVTQTFFTCWFWNMRPRSGRGTQKKHLLVIKYAVTKWLWQPEFFSEGYYNMNFSLKKSMTPPHASKKKSMTPPMQVQKKVRTPPSHNKRRVPNKGG